MAKLIERDGKQYCVEEDGTEWEYSPAEQTPDRPDRITQLENESAMLALELVDTQIRLDQAEMEQAALLNKKGGPIDGLVRNIKTAFRRRSI